MASKWIERAVVIGGVFSAAAAACSGPTEAPPPEPIQVATSALVDGGDGGAEESLLQSDEVLGVLHDRFTFLSAGSGTDSLSGTGFVRHGSEANGTTIRFFDGTGTQANGAYRIAYKLAGGDNNINFHFPNAVPATGGALFANPSPGTFDGAALWLGHSRFKSGSDPSSGPPPLNQSSPPNTGLRWDNSTGPADYATVARVEDARLIRIPVVTNKVVKRSFLISCQVYVPYHAGANHHVRVQPYLARDWAGMTLPEGIGSQQILFDSSKLDHWNLLEIRADITTNGGATPGSQDDSGEVTYTYHLNKQLDRTWNRPAVKTLQLVNMAATGGPLLLGPAFSVGRGWQFDAPEAFIDDIAVYEITKRGPVASTESLGAPVYELTFGAPTSGGPSLQGSGVESFASSADSLRFFDGSNTQSSGAFRIAYKRGPEEVGPNAEQITHLFPNGAPATGGTLFGGDAFDGTGLWLGHSRFQSGVPGQAGGPPPIGSNSAPTTGTRWDGSVGTADQSSTLRGDSQHTIELPFVTNESTRASYLISYQVFAPSHEGASHFFRSQPFLGRGANGATLPAGIGSHQISLEGKLDRWNLIQVRADLVTHGGYNAAATDDSGDVVYRFFLNGEPSGAWNTIGPAYRLLNLTTAQGPLKFAPAWSVGRGFQNDAPEVFVDNVSVAPILEAPCATDANCPDTMACNSGSCEPTTCTPSCAAGCGGGDGCGGFCPCLGAECEDDVDCGPGMVCGVNNGACFGGLRGKRVCWAAACQDGIDATECGQSDSVCGENCGCVTPCDANNPGTTCPSGEVCKKGMGPALGSKSRDVCLDPSCPSNDASDCGHPFSLCGARCICTPDCSSATCQDPSDGCGGECPNVCGNGDVGCKDDVHCPEGSTCVEGSDGVRKCRPDECNFRKLAPPLCGTSGAPCGEACPTCTPSCGSRECGVDPKCGTSCGSCAATEYCNVAGECIGNHLEVPVSVPDGDGGTRDLEDLPPGPTTPVGALRGEFSITEQGTPDYTVPIEVPSGRAGMEPALSLKYSSSRLNADVGVGWRLEGLSKITRCPRTSALDGNSRPIRNDKYDRFCIDGKRLEAVSGTYGNNGAQYRTLIDSFAKVISYKDSGEGLQLGDWAGVDRVDRSVQGPDYFRVWTKDGRILTYGRTLDSLVLGRNGVRYSWLLNRVEDRAGNTIVVTYENSDFDTGLPSYLSARFPGIVRPAAIAYTGHNDALGNREVRFFYETRTDPQLGFVQGGVASNSTQRLSRIVTYVAGTPVKNYRLQYGVGPSSQVHKIFECAGETDATCKAPTTFEYQEESGFAFVNAGPSLVTAGQLDANGDGIPDFLKTEVEVDGVDVSTALIAAQIGADVAVAIGTSFLTPAVGYPVSIVWEVVKGPFWGLFAEDPEVTITRTMFLGTGNRSAPVTTVNNVQGLPCLTSASFFLDYDRDGKDDLLSTCGIGKLFLSRSLGDGNFQQASGPVADVPVGTIFVPSTGHLGSFATNIPGPAPIMYDIDGDALQDVVSCADAYTVELRRRLAPGLGFDAPIKLESPPSIPLIPRESQPLCAVTRPTYKVFDLEGDGTQDLLVRGPEGWVALQYDPLNPEGPLSWRAVVFPDVGQSQYGGWGQDDGSRLSLGDLNGDGLLDVWNSGGNPGTAWINTGDGRFAGRTLLRSGMPSGIKLRRTALLDYDADGRDDIIEGYSNAAPRLNYAQRPNARVSQLTAQEALDLKWLAANGAFIHGDFLKAGDLDGDGTTDLFGDSTGVFYGKGAKNMALSRVVDGVGNVIRVSYYQELDTYQTDASCSGTTWPEICLKRMQGLVASHEVSVLNAAGQEVLERRYTHKYTNARMSVTGHGFLGFDRRSVSEAANGFPGRTITTQYEPVARYKTDGSGPATPSDRYLYPLAGLPRSVTVDQHVEVKGPLQSGLFERRNRIWNDWEVKVSASGRAYPWLGYRYSGVFDREVPENPLEPRPPFEENGLLVSNCTLESDSDDYGNVTYSAEYCQNSGDGALEQTFTWNTITPDSANWVIANPDQVTVQSSRGNAPAKTRGWEYSYDSDGLPESVMRLAYDGSASTLQHKTTYTRNAYGNVEQVLEEVASSAPSRTTTITYDDDQIFPQSVTNALGHVSQVRFDARWSAPKTVADANGIAVQHTYDAFGLVTMSRDPSGISAYSYSSLLASTDTPAGHIEPRVQVSVERQGLDGTHGGSSVQEFDYLGRTVRSRTEGFGGTEVVSEQAYDPLGRVVARALPRAVASTVVPTTSYTYDELGRVVRTDHSDGSFTERQYASVVTLKPMFSHWHSDIYNRFLPVEVAVGIDEEGRESAVVMDHRGNVIRSIDGDNIDIDPAAQTSNYKYGAFNSLIEARDNRGLLTSFDYDSYGRLKTHTDPDTGTSTFVFDGYDDLVTSVDREEQLRNYTYDALGRLETLVDPQGTSTWVYDQGVNALGRVSESFSPSIAGAPRQRVRYTYEAPTASNNRGALKTMTYVIENTEYASTFEYDGLGRTHRIHYPQLSGSSGNPIVAQYLYDEASGALEGLDEVGGSATKPIWRMTEAFEGHMVQRETFGNGAATTYGYHPERRFLDSIDTTLGSQHIQRFDYEHYDNGLLQESTDSRTTEAGTDFREYVYDQLNRLSSVTRTASGNPPQATSYGYDDIGNITNRGGTSVTYRTTQPHLISTAGGNSYQYNANGNVRERSGSGIPGNIQTIQYTPFDLPSRIVTGQAGAARVTTFDYTADEERVVRRDPDETLHFAGDLYQRKLGATGSTFEERFRLYAGGRQLGEIVRTHGTTPVPDQTLYFHTDRLGSVDTLSDDNDEDFRQEFDPFGAPIAPPNPEVTRSGYTGHQHDTDLGLIDMRGRVYDPLAGRFMTADPLMQAPFSTQGLNRYSYVFNNPINATDPSGFSVAFNAGTFTMGEESVSATPWTVDLGGSGAAGSSAPGAGSGVLGEVASTLGRGLGLAASIAQTVATGIGFGKGGYSYTAAPASAAPTTASATRTTQHAVGQNQGGVGSAVSDEWGPAPDLSNTAGPYAPAPPVANQILSNPEFRVTDTSETWHTALEVAMIAQGGLELGFEVGVIAVGRLATWRAARAAAALKLCFVAGTLVATANGAVAIEKLRVGDRVDTLPGGEKTTVDSSWRVVTVTVADGSEPDHLFDIELLRSPEWLKTHNVTSPGDRIFLELEEMGIAGVGTVELIRDAPRIGDGAGRVVLMTVNHLNSDVYELSFDGVEESLRPTGGHPLFSLDRDAWVPVRDLVVGERLQTAEGAVTIATLERIRGEHRVYNIEVEGEHEYLVTNERVRVHNTCFTPAGRAVSGHATKESLARHGFKSLSQLDDIVDKAYFKTVQRDGADVFLQRVGRGGRATYNLVVEGSEGIVTAMRGLNREAVRALGRNYDWAHMPF